MSRKAPSDVRPSSPKLLAPRIHSLPFPPDVTALWNSLMPRMQRFLVCPPARQSRRSSYRPAAFTLLTFVNTLGRLERLVPSAASLLATPARGSASPSLARSRPAGRHSIRDCCLRPSSFIFRPASLLKSSFCSFHSLLTGGVESTGSRRLRYCRTDFRKLFRRQTH
jgi:hypothetical protein